MGENPGDDARTSVVAGTATRVATALTVYEACKRTWDWGRARYQQATTYTLTVPESDASYPEVHAWLLDLTDEQDLRSLTVLSPRRHDDGMVSDDPAGSPAQAPPVRLQFNDRRPRRVRVDGHDVTAQVRPLEDAETAPARAGDGYLPLREKGIVFTCRSPEAQRAVVDHVSCLGATRSERAPRLMVVNRWGHWANRNDLPPRTRESVVLPPEQEERVFSDMERFLAAEPDYNRLAIPYHRGYLLHGPPGTGKTSLVKALANHFRLDLWYAPLADMAEEASLVDLLGNVGPRSIVLLEDVDTVDITHDRETQASGGGKQISLSGLLNALDGVATPHGLITVMTTNHFDRLDPALTRAGRMDVVEELGMPTWREVGTLFNRFYGDIWHDLGDSDCPLSQAQVSEILKTNMRDPEGALAALKEAVL